MRHLSPSVNLLIKGLGRAVPAREGAQTLLVAASPEMMDGELRCRSYGGYLQPGQGLGWLLVQNGYVLGSPVGSVRDRLCECAECGISNTMFQVCSRCEHRSRFRNPKSFVTSSLRSTLALIQLFRGTSSIRSISSGVAMFSFNNVLDYEHQRVKRDCTLASS